MLYILSKISTSDFGLLVLLKESVQLVRPIDLHMGDELMGKGDKEMVERWNVRLRHAQSKLRRDPDTVDK